MDSITGAGASHETDSERLYVYVLFPETNTGRAIEESDGYVDGVYATEALAEQARLVAIREAINDRQAVFYDPDTDREFSEYWEHDWHVERWPLAQTAPRTTRRKTGQ